MNNNKEMIRLSLTVFGTIDMTPQLRTSVNHFYYFSSMVGYCILLIPFGCKHRNHG